MKQLLELLLGAVNGTPGTGKAVCSSDACSVQPAPCLGRQRRRGWCAASIPEDGVLHSTVPCTALWRQHVEGRRKCPQG